MQEEYSDNINLSATDRKDDFITTVSPGIKLSNMEQRSSIDLDYRLGFVFYAHDSDKNYIRHEGLLNGHYNPVQSTTFRLRDYFVRSEEPRENAFTFVPTAVAQTGQTVLSTDRGRAVYWRNVLEPSIEYRPGPEDAIGLNFRDNVYRNENPLFQDSREDFINPYVTHWFNKTNGVYAEYGYLRGDFERSPDLIGHLARGRYMFRPQAGTTYFIEHIYLKRSFDSPGIDYDVHQPSLGIEKEFGPSLRGKIQVGYFWYSPESGADESGLAGELSLLYRLPMTDMSILFRWGYTEDYFTAEDLGFARYRQVLANITHRIERNLSAGITGSVEKADFTSGRDDTLWLVGGTTSYLPLQWLTLSLDIQHRETRSSIDAFDFMENRVIFRITAVY